MGCKFDRGFRFGFSTVGVQHEMGLPGSEFVSDWVLWLHDPENIAAGIVSGDRPEDGPGYWHLFREDNERAVWLGMDAAWFTIEWARIFPKPTFEVEVPVERSREGLVAVNVDQEHVRRLEKLADIGAVKRYREIFEDWKGRGGFLIANLFHWSIPVWLHDPVKVRKLGPDRAPSGWLDERTVVEFAKFAAFAASVFDDLVDAWYTMNEPEVVAMLGYVSVRSGFPPGYLDLKCYEVARKHLAEAHARAYDAVKTFSKKPVGIVESVAAWTPLTEEDREAADAGFERNIWPYEAAVKGVLAGGVRDDLRGRLDWVGLNYYTRSVVRKVPGGYTVLSGYGYSCPPGGSSKAGRPASDFGWEVYPEGLYEVLIRLWKRYRLPIYVTENGIADASDRLRSHFIVSHLYQVHRAASEGVDVRGYFHWNLFDNLEWAQGYRMRFGLFHVDFATKRRYARPSALVFREIARGKEIPDYLMHLTEPPRVSG
ncbi:MAG: beta-galactosidase BgaS [Thermofilaceae archaeon]